MSEGSMRRRRLPASPALGGAPLPDDDDLLREILLRLPPLPSSLPRASLVSKRWCRILSDPQFLRRFRAFHHRRAPLLGLYTCNMGSPYFTPTLDPPDRIPSSRLSLSLVLPHNEAWGFLGCRHGLLLLLNLTRREIIVCDPVTRDQRRVPLPPGFNSKYLYLPVCGDVLLCDDHPGRVPLESFKVVLVWKYRDDALAILYESKADVWSNISSTSIRGRFLLTRRSILVGNSLYWLLLGYMKIGILKFDLDGNNLTAIDAPTDARDALGSQILRLDDSRRSFAMLTDLSIQVWEKKPNSEVGAKWMLHKTINLDKLLSLGPDDRSLIKINGYDEDSNAIFVAAYQRVFMIQLKSLQFKSIFEDVKIYHPFRSFYTTGRGIGSGDVGAEILNNT